MEHAGSDSCGNWTLQVVRIFQSLAGRACLIPLNLSKRDAGGVCEILAGERWLQPGSASRARRERWLCQASMPRHLEVGTGQCQTDLLSRLMAFVCVTLTPAALHVCASLGKQVRLAPALPCPAVTFILPPASWWGPEGTWLRRRDEHSWTSAAAEESPKGWSDNPLQAFSGWKRWVEREKLFRLNEGDIIKVTGQLSKGKI